MQPTPPAAGDPGRQRATTMTGSVESLLAAIGCARIARVIPNVLDPTTSPVKGALLELMLPAVHLLNAVAILDEALSD